MTLDVVLVDKGESFVFGFSKLDVMFGRHSAAHAHHAYRDLVHPGVRFVRTHVRAIDPSAKRAITDHGTFESDILVVALGADLDPSATPGLVKGGHEFYTVAGAEALRYFVPRFERGAAIVGVTGRTSLKSEDFAGLGRTKTVDFVGYEKKVLAPTTHPKKLVG